MTTTAKRIEVHQSEVNDFELCGEYYRRKHVDKEPAHPGTAALRGSGVHGAAELNYKQKIKTARDLPRKDLVDAAVAAFEERKSKDGFRLTPDEISVGVVPSLERAKMDSAKLTGTYSEKLAPKVQPKHVELFIKAEIPNSNVDLAGTIDVVDVADDISDMKTSTRAKSQSEADQSNQFSQYGILYHAKTGIWPKQFFLDTLVDYKRGPDLVRRITGRNPKDYGAYVNRLNVMLLSREKGIFAPAGVGAWFCSQKWCPFFHNCVYVNSERLAASAKLEE